MTDYERARWAMRGHLLAAKEYEKRAEGQFLVTDVPYGIRHRCGLCRFVQRSSKSFSRKRDICLSCSMRDNRPRWVNIENAVIASWRGATLSQIDLAAFSGIAQPNICRLERGHNRMRADTAIRIATGFVRAGSAGHSLRQLMLDWPLFPLLVDQSVVNAHVADVVEITEHLDGA